MAPNPVRRFRIALSKDLSMSSRLILSLAAAMAFAAAPALAQTDAPAPAAPAPAAPEVASPAAPAAAAPTEADVDAASEVFEADMAALTQELTAAKTEAGTDTAKANAAADIIVAKYQPKADAFADLVSALLATLPIPAEDQAQVAAGMAQLRSVPQQVRDGVMAAPAEAPAAQ
jgi:hypothetical protein